MVATMRRTWKTASQRHLSLVLGGLAVLAGIVLVMCDIVSIPYQATFSSFTPKAQKDSSSYCREPTSSSRDTLLGDKRPTPSDTRSKNTCRCQPHLRHTIFQGDLLNRQDLIRMAQNAKERLMDKLREDYGDYVESIFVGPGKSFSPISQQSEDQLKRKLIIKVLEMQVNVRENDQQQPSSWYDCDGDDLDAATSGPYYAKYVWATGGHSSAAGHGNLYNESYTSHLTRDAKTVFDAIGIEFEGRNYAMGNTQTGAEVSMCWRQIFGSDVDFIAWDFAQTDLRNPERLFHFGYRGALSPGRPPLIAVRIGGLSQDGWKNTLQLMDQFGMSVFLGTEESFELRRAGVPNSEGITNAEIDALPYYVRNLVCGEQFERGDPFCERDKYTNGACAPRPYQASWHPGFKSHALDGHALGLFLVDSLIAALIDLSQNEIVDPIVLLDILRKQEDSMHERLLSTEFPIPFSAIYQSQDGAPPDPSLDLEVFWKGPSLCRTARLPAQSRYLGYTTNTAKVGNIAIQGLEEYDTGIPMENATSPDVASGGFMVLSHYGFWGDNARAECDVILTPDYKDFFLAHYNHGLVKVSLPNEKERFAYEYDPSRYKGLIVIVFSQCEHRDCKEGDLGPNDYVERKFAMKVNDKDVTELTSAGFDAFILKGEHGFFWQAPTNDGTFEVAFEVLLDGGYVRLSSIILF